MVFATYAGSSPTRHGIRQYAPPARCAERCAERALRALRAFYGMLLAALLLCGVSGRGDAMREIYICRRLLCAYVRRRRGARAHHRAAQRARERAPIVSGMPRCRGRCERRRQSVPRKRFTLRAAARHKSSTAMARKDDARRCCEPCKKGAARADTAR